MKLNLPCRLFATLAGALIVGVAVTQQRIGGQTISPNGGASARPQHNRRLRRR